MNIPTSRRTTVTTIAALVLTALALLSPMAQAQGTLERARADDLVRIAIADEPPYGYVDENGNITGESPEIARHILSMIDPDIETEGQVTLFSNLMSGLNANEFDIATAGMYITPSRCNVVAFTNPTYVMGEAFLVKKGNPKNISDYHSVSANPDAVVGLLAGAVEYNYALVAGVPAERALLYQTPAKAVAALEAGKIDGLGLTTLSVRELRERAENPANLEVTEQFYPVIDGKQVKGYGAFAFRKEDQDFVDAFNEHLAGFVGSEEHWELVKPFGFTPDMEPDKTAAELCAG